MFIWFGIIGTVKHDIYKFVPCLAVRIINGAAFMVKEITTNEILRNINNRFYHMNLYFILLFSPRKVLIDGKVRPCEKMSFVDPFRRVKLRKLFLFAFSDYN